MLDRVQGCLLGLALGDALGAPYEGLRVPQFVPDTLPYTDDTEMAIGLVESLLEHPDVDQDHLASRFAANYNPERSYGGGTHRILHALKEGLSWRILNRKYFPEGSFGNGASMRVAPLGLLFTDPQKLREAAERSAEVTHAHRLGKEGAVVVAYAASVAFRESRATVCGTSLLEELKMFTTQDEFRGRFGIAIDLLRKPHDPRRVIDELGNGIEAHRSAPTAIYLAARFSDDYDQAVERAIELGGDTDTIAAMTGGIVGAHVGKSGLPPFENLENRARLEELAGRFAGVIMRP